MAAVNPKVMAFVEAELKKHPDISSKELYEAAKKKYRSVREMSVRQFHATYPLRIRRMAAAKKPRPKRPRAAKAKSAVPNSNGQRDAVRNALLEFASEIESASERADLVKVLANVDRYVDKVIKSAS